MRHGKGVAYSSSTGTFGLLPPFELCLTCSFIFAADNTAAAAVAAATTAANWWLILENMFVNYYCYFWGVRF